MFPGYHSKGCLTPQDGMYHQLPDDAVDRSTGVVARSRARRRRDLQRLHAAPIRRRTDPRRAARLLYLSYNALSDGGEQRDRHYAEFHGWLQERYAEYGKTSTFFR